MNVHAVSDCQPPCPFHAPTDHKMVGWPKVIRETNLTERLCEHGIGHPDPDSALYMMRQTDDESWLTHGCDGCCEGAYDGLLTEVDAGVSNDLVTAGLIASVSNYVLVLAEGQEAAQRHSDPNHPELSHYVDKAQEALSTMVAAYRIWEERHPEGPGITVRTIEVPGGLIN